MAHAYSEAVDMTKYVLNLKPIGDHFPKQITSLNSLNHCPLFIECSELFAVKPNFDAGPSALYGPSILQTPPTSLHRSFRKRI
jgi:hypothetical protein